MKKKLLTFMLIAAGVLTAGCSAKKQEPIKMTAEELVKKMQAASADSNFYSADFYMDLQFNIGVKAEGQEINLDMGILYDCSMMGSNEPLKSYTTGAMQIDMLGQAYSINIENYVTVTDDEVVSYTYMPETDLWTKQPTGMTEEAYAKAHSTGIDVDAYMNASKMELSDKTTTIDGNEVYVLNMTYSGEQMQDVFNQMGNSGVFDTAGLSLDGVSFENLTIPGTCYVDTDTYLLVGVEMEIEGMDEILTQLYASLLGAEGDSTEITVEIPTFYIEIFNMNYEETTIPDLPQEAIVKAEEI